MNSYQRYVGMLRGQSVDVVPRIPILMHYAAHHANMTYADFARDYRQFTKHKSQMIEEYDFEQLDLMSDPWRETTAFGGQIEYLESRMLSFRKIREIF